MSDGVITDLYQSDKGPKKSPKNGWWTLINKWAPLMSNMYVVWTHALDTTKSRSIVRFWRECELIGEPQAMYHETGIYTIYQPFNNGCYIGETSCGVFNRYKSHISNARNSKKRNCAFMEQIRKDGWWKFVPVPVISIPTECAVATRKFLELRLIKWINPRWNTAGANTVWEKNWGEKTIKIDSGKTTKPNRPLKKYRTARSIGWFAKSCSLSLNPVVDRTVDVLSYVVRLSRRPIRAIPKPMAVEFDRISNNKRHQIVKCAEHFLNEKEFGIFQGNWMRIYKYRWDFETDIICSHKIKLLGGFSTEIQSALKNALTPLVQQCAKVSGKRIKLNITIFAESPKTTYDYLRNEHMWGKEDKSPEV